MFYIIFVVCVLIVFFFLVGFLVDFILFKFSNRIYKLNNVSFYLNLESFFLKILTGFVFSISVFSIVASSGRTIFLIFIIFWIIWIVIKNIESNKVFKMNENYVSKSFVLVLTLILVLFVVLVKYISFYQAIVIQRSAPYIDDFYYARASYNIYMTGIENSSPLLLEWPGDIHGTIPYHYFELWFTVFIYKIFSINLIESRILIGSSFFIILTGIGFVALLQKVDNLKKILFVVIFGLILTGIPWFGNNGVAGHFKDTFVFSYNIFFENKLNILQVFVIVPFLCYRKGCYKSMIVSILFVPFLFISTFPTIFIGLCISSVYIYVHLKNKKLAIFCLVVNILCFVLIYMFYLINGSSGESMLKYISVDKTLITSRLRQVMTYVIQRFVLFLPYFMLVVLFQKNIFKKISKSLYFMILFFTLLSGIMLWVIFNAFYDAFQFYNNIEIVALNLFVFIAWSRSVQSRTISVYSKISWIICAIISAFLIGNQIKETFNRKPFYSVDYLNNIKQVLKYIPEGSRGASLNYQKTRTTEGYEYNGINVLGGYLTYFNPNLQPTNILLPLSNSELKTIHPTFQELFMKNPIFKFIAEKNLYQDSIEEQQFKFIMEEKIKYLILSKDATLDSRLPIQIRVVDELSGEKFIILKN
jgi:hypothetical protein